MYVSDNSNYCISIEYRIKYSITKENYLWKKPWYQPLFNSGQGLIKRIVHIKGIAEKETMKKSYFGINTVFRLQLSSIKKMCLMNLSPFPKTTNEHLVQLVYCKFNKRNQIPTTAVITKIENLKGESQLLFKESLMFANACRHYPLYHESNSISSYHIALFPKCS